MQDNIENKTELSVQKEVSKPIQLPEIYTQSPMYCGPTCLRMLLKYYGVEKSEQELAELTSASRETGTPPKNIVRIAQELGFRAEFKQDSSIDELRSLTESGIPVIVDWLHPKEGGHYSIVVHVDKEELVIAEPLTGDLQKMTIDEFMSRWYDPDDINPEQSLSRAIITISK